MSEAKQQNWHLEIDSSRVGWLKFDKAEASANTLSRDVMVELGERLEEVEKEDIKGLIVYSAKKSGFIAGADIKEFTTLNSADEALDLIRNGQKVLERLEGLKCTTVAAIHGFALGGGLELALACDYRVAADDERTQLGLPEVKLGIHPGFGGTVRSIRLVGVFSAMDMMLSGRSLRGKAALKIGLVDRLVPHDSMHDAARQIALTPPGKKKAPFTARLANLPGVRGFMAGQMEKQVAAKAPKQHYPAPYAIIDLWRRHWGNEGQMYQEEAQSIARLMMGETARNLVRVFLLQDKLKGLGNKKDLDLKRVHVVGAGVMGGDIAAWSALSGFEVTLQDQNEEQVQGALDRARKLFEKKLKTEDKVKAAVDRLRMDIAGDGVAQADVVIEAIFENVEAKQSLYNELEPRMRKDAVLATNTSSIRLETLRGTLSDPKRLVGLHFFNPVAKMPLVEVIHTDDTDSEVIRKALAYTRHVNRLPVPCKSAPGFLVNRILMPYMMEAVLAYEDGVPLEAIDKAAKNYGMPMGPVELADTVGLDVGLSVAKILGKEFDMPVPTELEKMVEAKKLGRKTGEGFYKYEDGKAVKDRSKANEIPADLTDRLVLPMINTAVACLREGIVENEEILDGGVIFGTGFAPFRGGPINYARSEGIKEVKSRLEKLQKTYGDRFKPDAGWDQL
ncbi:3-hydroxyacyl-CoA dehydrogenase NAD-binding domain-containing protein [Gammaproteobacteria bacterium AB-CW1]|uniref:enoyl-CoA hydratase n=1 Tax=Natronospira elongata TaxID=3110268 RepID=A0AAP6JET8_9GAMM|nr:3-hydroxyacyl-CoA dehydrogenase NAD-binding domain-containing protein [Gammaproteobacteria bacterium AB-CW1]